MDLHNGKWWWAYLDDRGKIKILPYTTDKIIQNTEQLPFTRGIFEPFKAESRHHAEQIIAAFLTEEAYYEKKTNG
jgi:hypothetical protein